MLVLDRVSREFANGAGVREVDLHVPSGQVVALIGLNGAGKTTLMRLALGMLRPGTGGARLFGEPLPALPASRWREVGALVGRRRPIPSAPRGRTCGSWRGCAGCRPQMWRRCCSAGR